MTRARKSGADATRRVLLTHPSDTRMTLQLVRKGGGRGQEGERVGQQRREVPGGAGSGAAACGGSRP